jgi:transcription elongation factor Elf1
MERRRKVMWLKSCPRCRGDLVLDSDFYGGYVSCIQCGASLNTRAPSPLQQRLFADAAAADLPETESESPATQERVA